MGPSNGQDEELFNGNLHNQPSPRHLEGLESPQVAGLPSPQ